MQRITVSLPDSDAEALRALAAGSCTTVSELFRSLIPRPAAPEGEPPAPCPAAAQPRGCGVSVPLSDRESAVLAAAAGSCGMGVEAYVSRVIADCVSTGLRPPTGRLKGVWGHAAERAGVFVPLEPACLEALAARGWDAAQAARGLLAAAHTGHPFREDLRLSAPERMGLASAAAASGLTKVAYLRRLIGQVRVRAVSVVSDAGELRAARADLKRTGSSVNQIARLAHAGSPVAPEDAEETLRAYRDACARLERALGGGGDDR